MTVEKNTKFAFKNIIIGLTVMVLISGSMFYLFTKVNSKNDKLEMDKNVMVGNVNGDDLEKRLREAQEKVDEGRLAIDIAPNPIFKDGKSSGKAMIGNPISNTKNFTVEFIIEDTNESVYISGLIPPGSYIEEIKLEKELGKGKYPTIAYFTSYNNDGIEVGKVGLNIDITIEN